MTDLLRTHDRVRLVVIFGGQSAEHDVSRVSARHVVAALDPDRYQVTPVAITKQGDWVLAEAARQALEESPASLPEALEASGPPVDLIPWLGRASTEARPGEAPDPVVVLPLLHGPLGEDGTVQGLLELVGVPYVGCGVLASALAMDKAMAKEVLRAAGLPQARHRTRHADEIDAATPGRLAEELGLPLFVKPANMGSSIGVSRAETLPEVAQALTLALSYDEVVVVEEAITGREIECAVIGNRKPRASLPGEIIPGADFYDFDDKYRDGSAQLQIPAPLTSEETTQVQSLAVDAFRAVHGEGMARVDFFYESDGRGFLVNEINTIPGFTPISMYPKMWQASGMAYSELIDELVELALERHRRRRRRVD